MALVTIIVGRAFQARTLPDLKPWHRHPGRGSRARPPSSGADYLKREDAIFAELARRVGRLARPGGPHGRQPLLRRQPGQSDEVSVNYNRTFQLAPDEPAASAAACSSSTDCPTAPTACGPLALRDRGFYALALRMQGHGAIPEGLVEAKWPDWMAAVGSSPPRAGAHRRMPFSSWATRNGGALSSSSTRSTP